MKILYTDIDYVLSLSSEYKTHNTKWGNIHKFNQKAVSVLNDILLNTGAAIVVSSDWKYHFSLEQLKEIFISWGKVCRPPIDITPNILGITMERLEEFRAKEILQHVEENKPEAWVAIDDLDLSKWIEPLHFVHLSMSNEGIKQSSKKEEIIEKLNIKELENEYFSDWEDDSWPNYVGWLKRFLDFNIIVSRKYAQFPGLYDVTRVAPNIDSASDSSGEHPEYWKDRTDNLLLSEVKKIIKKYDKSNF